MERADARTQSRGAVREECDGRKRRRLGDGRTRRRGDPRGLPRRFRGHTLAEGRADGEVTRSPERARREPHDIQDERRIRNFGPGRAEHTGAANHYARTLRHWWMTAT